MCCPPPPPFLLRKPLLPLFAEVRKDTLGMEGMFSPLPECIHRGWETGVSTIQFFYFSANCSYIPSPFPPFLSFAENENTSRLESTPPLPSPGARHADNPRCGPRRSGSSRLLLSFQPSRGEVYKKQALLLRVRAQRKRGF